MVDSDLTKLRRHRIRAHHVLAKLEPLVEGYRAKLAWLEAEISALAPLAILTPRFHKPNPYFRKGELPRITLTIMREAKGPIAVKEIVLRALASKGCTVPDRATMKTTRVRVGQFMAELGRRGLVEKVGVGKAGKRRLV